MRHAAAALQLPGLSLHHLAQTLDFVAINGAAAQYHFEAVVVLGVVAARHLDAALASGAGHKVQHGRGGQANVDDLNTSRHQTPYQRGRQCGATQAAVAPHRHRALTLGQGMRAKCLAQALGHLLIQGGRHDAADVVGFEDRRGDLHGVWDWSG